MLVRSCGRSFCVSGGITRMKPELAEKILALIEAPSEAQPTAMEFEMAYQGRVAIDRIKFAIKHIEQFGPHTDQMREGALQLLDGLERLESAERKFQRRFRGSQEFVCGESAAQANGIVHDGRKDGKRNRI